MYKFAYCNRCRWDWTSSNSFIANRIEHTGRCSSRNNMMQSSLPNRRKYNVTIVLSRFPGKRKNKKKKPTKNEMLKIGASFERILSKKDRKKSFYSVRCYPLFSQIEFYHFTQILHLFPSPTLTTKKNHQHPF